MDFAIVDELEVRWRPFTSDAERDKAAALLGAASRLVRARVPSVDERITATTLDPLLVGDVVLDMVRRAMIGGAPGAQTAQTSVGQVSTSFTYSNPMGNLYMTADELSRLAASGGSGRAFAVDLTPVYPVI